MKLLLLIIFVFCEMSKNKDANKLLSRNIPLQQENCKTVDKSHNLKKVHFSDDLLSEDENKVFEVPQFCTLLQLADEMKTIRNSQCSSRSFPEVSKSRNLNFLPGEKIYQDLVEIDMPKEEFVSEVKSQPCVKLRKDPNLDFSKYSKYDLQPEYFFTASAIPVINMERIGFNGHSIYKKMVMWSDLID